MSVEIPQVPPGNGKHPIPMAVVAANDLAASAAFYTKLLGWQAMPMGAQLTTLIAPSGPSLALRADNPQGFPGVVPFVAVPDVAAALASAVAAGGSVERELWNLPMVGTLARFKDPSGTLYGLTSMAAPAPRVPMPFGANPKPPARTVCSFEMYASDGAAAAKFFGGLFGWGSLATMEQYMAFDPGAGVGGVFQSHTPALPAVAYFWVDDVTATLATVESLGGRRVGDPMAMPGMATFGYFKDPSGTTMGLIGP
jgi:uncharacterized protein